MRRQFKDDTMPTGSELKAGQVTPKKVPVRTFARSFLTSNPLTKATIHLYEEDEKSSKLQLISSAITDEKGDAPLFYCEPNKRVAMRIECEGYQTTQTGIITVPTEGINDSKQAKNVAHQVPSNGLGVKGFAIAMQVPLTKDGFAEGVIATVAEEGVTLDDLPQGCPGATGTLEFEDPNIQAAWEIIVKQNATNRRFNDFLQYGRYATTAAAAATTWMKTKSPLATAGAAITTHGSSAVITQKLAKTVNPYYFGVWQSGPLKYKTNPWGGNDIRTTPDGGIYFNTQGLNLPATGAKFTLTIRYKDQVIKRTGYAFPNSLTNLAPPHGPAVKVLAEVSQRFMYGPLPAKEEEIPALTAKSLGVGVIASVASLVATTNKPLSAAIGAIGTLLAWNQLKTPPDHKKERFVADVISATHKL